MYRRKHAIVRTVMPKGGHIATGPIVNKHRIVFTGRFVVLAYFAPEPASFAANDGVDTRVVWGLAVVHLCPDQVFLERCAGTGESCFHSEAKKPSKAFRLRKHRALQHAR